MAAITKVNSVISVKLILYKVGLYEARSKNLHIHLGLLFYVKWRSNRSVNQADEVPAQVYSGRV